MNNLLLFKKVTAYGSGLGFVIFLFGIIVSDFNYSNFLSLFGIGIMTASLVTLGLGVFLYLLEEVAQKSKGNHTLQPKDNLYYFLEKRTFY